MFGITTEIGLFVAHYWFVQHDLLTYVIKSNFISRQQTQLKQFFNDGVDPIFVLLNDGSSKIQFMNPAAKKIYERHNLEQSVASEIIFALDMQDSEEPTLSLKDLTKDD